MQLCIGSNHHWYHFYVCFFFFFFWESNFMSACLVCNVTFLCLFRMLDFILLYRKVRMSWIISESCDFFNLMRLDGLITIGLGLTLSIAISFCQLYQKNNCDSQCEDQNITSINEAREPQLWLGDFSFFSLFTWSSSQLACLGKWWALCHHPTIKAPGAASQLFNRRGK